MPCFHIAIRTASGSYMAYGKFRGHEGIPEVSPDTHSMTLSDRQFWRILKSHAAYLEVSPFPHFKG